MVTHVGTGREGWRGIGSAGMSGGGGRMCESGTTSLKHTPSAFNKEETISKTNSKQKSTKKGPLTVRRPLKILHLLRRKFRLRFPLSISLTTLNPIPSPVPVINTTQKLNINPKTESIPPQTSFAKKRTNTLVPSCEMIDVCQQAAVTDS